MRKLGRFRWMLVTGVALVLLTAGLISTAGLGRADSAPCEPPPNSVAQLFLSQSASVVGSDVSYALTVYNIGPCSATNATITDLLPVGFTFNGCVSVKGAWSCSVDGQKVTAILGSNLAPSNNPGNPSRAAVTINATPPSPGENGTNDAVVSALESDPDCTVPLPCFDQGSDNESLAAVGTFASTGHANPNKPQGVDVQIQAAGSISIQQVKPGSSPLAASVVAPCEGSNACVLVNEVLVSAPDTNPAQFPTQKLVLTVTVYAPGLKNTSGISVYRFHEEAQSPYWSPALPNKCGGFKGDPVDGCVNKMFLGGGVLTIIIWTSHNGHVR